VKGKGKPKEKVVGAKKQVVTKKGAQVKTSVGVSEGNAGTSHNRYQFAFSDIDLPECRGHPDSETCSYIDVETKATLHVFSIFENRCGSKPHIL
jgi:hypothetical protein